MKNGEDRKKHGPPETSLATWMKQTRQSKDEGLIPKHGGFRKLKTFQLAEVIYDVTARFCEKYVDPRSRTRDQMVQAARSGRQNIAEGSVDAATSKKMEMKLTGVAKGSLEELRLDYEDYLRQRGLPRWEPEHPALRRFKARRCGSLEEFRAWVGEEMKRVGENTDDHGQTRTITDKHGRNTDKHGRNTDRYGETKKMQAAGTSVEVCVRPCMWPTAHCPCSIFAFTCSIAS